MGQDSENDVTLVIWTDLALLPDGQTTANTVVSPIRDEIYAGLTLAS
ncbi:hypothetical protein C6A86_014670 [Mycobacterium sp. ITM-2016-00316]|nr:hypothetical protein [Mycobacterium sp. ITM-2016-00316]WNG79552.1 hypothetical protein C6A86_014670 [Mycobacterium sp. ITM-2016-00316]